MGMTIPDKTYFVYILSNKHNTTIYVGITNNLARRTIEHKEGADSKFTKRYNINKLVYYEEYAHPDDAITREKQMKNYSRKRKNELINKSNPNWNDLFNDMAIL